SRSARRSAPWRPGPPWRPARARYWRSPGSRTAASPSRGSFRACPRRTYGGRIRPLLSTLAPPAERRPDDHPGNESAHVRPHGDAAVRRGAERRHARGDLPDEPDEEEEDRGDLDDLDEEEDGKDRDDARRRKEQEIGPRDARDGAARSHHGDARMHRGERMRRAGRRAAEEIEDRVADVPEPVLDVVAEDVEVEHVAEDVDPTGVNEHARHERRHRELARDEPVVEEKPFDPRAERRLV